MPPKPETLVEMVKDAHALWQRARNIGFTDIAEDIEAVRANLQIELGTILATEALKK